MLQLMRRGVFQILFSKGLYEFPGPGHGEFRSQRPNGHIASARRDIDYPSQSSAIIHDISLLDSNHLLSLVFIYMPDGLFADKLCYDNLITPELVKVFLV